MKKKKTGINTKMIHAGSVKDKYGSAVTPIYQSSTFYFEDVKQGADRFAGADEGYIYTRLGNPTITDLENTITDLEGGYRGLATSSGMGAINTVYLSFLKSGDHIISTASVYGPSRSIIEGFYTKYGIESTYMSLTNLEEVKDSIKDNTKLIYIETPTNPTMELTDIKKIVQIARKRKIPVCVDNTFCSPYLQRPISFGADIVVHSITKSINGHADIVGGAIVARKKTHFQLLRNTMVNMGFNMDPHQAFMVRRGLKTLGIRIERAQENAMIIANYLEKHPKVKKVLYPGLKSYPQYKLAKRQMDGPGSMMSIFLKGGFNAGVKLLNHVQVPLLAVSLGGVESLIQHPASMTHSKLSKKVRKAAGISDGLIRFSVGIEDVQDIINDLDQALEKV